MQKRVDNCIVISFMFYISNLIEPMYRRTYSVTFVRVCVQVRRARVSSRVSVYEVDVSGGQYPSSSSSSLAAVVVYNATDVDQVSVSANHISLQLPQSISTGSGAYSVLLQTGNDSPSHLAYFTVLRPMSHLRFCCATSARL